MVLEKCMSPYSRWSMSLSAALSISLCCLKAEWASAVVNTLMELDATARAEAGRLYENIWRASAERLLMYFACCERVLPHRSYLWPTCSVSDSHRACHFCQGDQLRLSSTSRKAHHRAGPQRHPRYASFNIPLILGFWSISFEFQLSSFITLLYILKYCSFYL